VKPKARVATNRKKPVIQVRSRGGRYALSSRTLNRWRKTVNTMRFADHA
jgi:hypothetical protein